MAKPKTEVKADTAPEPSRKSTKQPFRNCRQASPHCQGTPKQRHMRYAAQQR